MIARRILLFGIALAECGAAQDVIKTFEDPAFSDTPANILVVGAHADRNVRGIFENGLLRALRSAGAAGQSSLEEMGGTQPLTADTVLAAAHRTGADAVLVTRVLDVQTRNPGATTTFEEYFRAYAAREDPLPVITTHTVFVRSDLYVVTTQKRVWGVESTAFEKSNLFGVVDTLARTLTEQLAADSLIP